MTQWTGLSVISYQLSVISYQLSCFSINECFLLIFNSFICPSLTKLPEVSLYSLYLNSDN
ncbi:MAG: hypothetical protein DRR16_31285 [Candidatus Parabeggiatoa sp. nov. 3]|nr:MAG: hypothetical protein DRR00_32060 [Gammaproteobacteria bacterium]RKZ54657.1 MAG: hypothetical protein DRQ99_31090 [Gammaproteobacteria bacterium]RKZ75439.1 MAG: hypothetical protein DRR16_31285 [Gammaproteobacteria bacterium]HEW97494.1 hypothetical protein [Beggiatoa sp.]